MKFNIANRLDISALNRKINYAYDKTYDFYIFMSPDTLADMPQLDDYEFIGVSTRNNHTGMVGTYHGHKVFSDPSMEYGEVEIR